MVKWKNLGINYKLFFGFGLVTLLLMGIALWSILGISQIVLNASEVIDGNKLDGSLAQKEVDHLNWAGEVNALLTDDSIKELNVELDDHNCAFGLWLYGPEREEAIALIPTLAPLLKSIEEPHKNLHTSAAEIKDLFHQADATLPAVLAMREIEHLNWASSIRDSLLRGESRLTVQTDPRLCNLGKWLSSPEGRNIYKNGSPAFQKEWDEMLVTHENLHTSAIELENRLRRNRASGLDYFSNQTLPYLEQTISHIREMKSIAEEELFRMNQAAAIYSTHTQPALVEVQSLLNSIRKEVRANLMTDEQMIDAAINTRKGVIITSIIAFSLGILIAFIIARGITGPMLKGVAFAESLSQGDLTVSIDINQKDEIGKLALSLNHMKESLTEVVNQVKNGSSYVTDGSYQLSETSQILSQGAAEQAASAEEISSSMEQMSANIEQNADNSTATEAIAREASLAVEKGGQSVMETVEAMKAISEKISIIEEIARSTNMLSLNAAIEAARAGEHGKGFAVVAAEVGKLASNSNLAAGEISELAERSVIQAVEAGNMMMEIVPKIQKTADLIQEISAASREQKSGAAQISQAITQLDTVIQQNASSSEEAASMAEELSSQAENLKQQISFFKISEITYKPDATETTLKIPAPQAAAAPRETSPTGIDENFENY